MAAGIKFIQHDVAVEPTGGSLYAQNFHLRGRPPPTVCGAQLHRPVNTLQLCADSFHTRKLYSRLSSRDMQFYSENIHFGVLSPLSGFKRTYAVLLRLVRKVVLDFLLVIRLRRYE